jgi:hypothetical protein
MHYIKESAIRRMIKYTGNYCVSCLCDEEDGYTDWGIELYGDDIGFTCNGEERFAHIDCLTSKAFNKWKISSKRNIRMFVE